MVWLSADENHPEYDPQCMPQHLRMIVMVRSKVKTLNLLLISYGLEQIIKLLQVFSTAEIRIMINIQSLSVRFE